MSASSEPGPSTGRSACRVSVADRLRSMGGESPRPDVLSPLPLSPLPPHHKQLCGVPQLNTTQKSMLSVVSQYCRDIGLYETAETMQRESGCTMNEDPRARRLRDILRNASFLDAMEVVHECSDLLTEQQTIRAMEILVEERVHFLVDKLKAPLALQYLREAVPWLHRDLHRSLSAHVFNCRRKSARGPWGDGDTKRIITRLRAVLPDGFIREPVRLEHIVQSGWNNHKTACPIHALHTAHDIHEEHSDEVFELAAEEQVEDEEVWTCEVSPCGRFIAAARRCKRIFLYRTDGDSPLEFMGEVGDDQRGTADDIRALATLKWSHDSFLIATTANDDERQAHYNLWVWRADSTEGGSSLYAKVNARHDYNFRDASFFPGLRDNGAYSMALADGNGRFVVFDITPNHAVERIVHGGSRLIGVHVFRSFDVAIAFDAHRRVRLYEDLEERDNRQVSTRVLFQEETTITHMVVHPDERLVLLVCPERGLRLWNLRASQLIRTFVGISHVRDNIIHDCRASFGGPNDQFIATGGVNGEILVYSIHHSYPLTKIAATSRNQATAVNSACWSPSHKHGPHSRRLTTLISISEDGMLKVWKTRRGVVEEAEDEETERRKEENGGLVKEKEEEEGEEREEEEEETRGEEDDDDPILLPPPKDEEDEEDEEEEDEDDEEWDEDEEEGEEGEESMDGGEEIEDEDMDDEEGDDADSIAVNDEEHRRM